MAAHLSAESYAFEVLISATAERVWQALTKESSAWWPKGLHTSPHTQRFVIEAVLGGRAFEDFGQGDGLQWYSVVGIEAGRRLLLAGHLLPPFGGPAITALSLTVSTGPGGRAVLEVKDDRFGVPGGESPVEGWRMVFDEGLRQHVESGREPA